MVSKCANPECSARFHYLRDGKVFQLEVEQNRGSEPRPVSGQRAVHHIEHFWLCSACAQTMTLTVEKDKGVVATPIKPPVLRVAAAS